MNIKSFPKDTKQKLKIIETKISTMNSHELLEYSKNVRAEKSFLGDGEYDYILGVIDKRRKDINSGMDKKEECKMKKMVRDFMRGGK